MSKKPNDCLRLRLFRIISRHLATRSVQGGLCVTLHNPLKKTNLQKKMLSTITQSVILQSWILSHFKLYTRNNKYKMKATS